MSFVLLGILNSQAAAAGFDPADLNPDLWLDASDASTITESGGSVSQWNNKGTLENFTQGTSSLQPTTGVTSQNGLNTIKFDKEFLEGSTPSNWTFMHDGTDYFVAGVFKIGLTSNPDAVYLVFGNEFSSGDVGHRFTYDDRASVPSNNQFRYEIYNGGGDVVAILDNDFITANTFSIISTLLNPSADAAERIDYFLNDTQGALTNSASGSPSATSSANNFQVGSVRSAGESLQGEIGELIIVSGADATETNRAEVISYLNSKWSVF